MSQRGQFNPRFRGGGPPGHFQSPQNRKRGRDDGDGGGPMNGGGFQQRGPQRRRLNDGSPGGRPGGPMGRPVDRFRTDFVRLGDDEPRFPHRYPEMDAPPPRPVFIADIRGVDGVRMAFEELWWNSKPDLMEAFMAVISSLPHKLPHYAAVLAALAASPFVVNSGPPQPQFQPDGAPKTEDAMDEDTAVQSNIGRIIIDHLSQQLVVLVETQQWRTARLLLHLFAHLACLPIPLVDIQSLAGILCALATALEPSTRTTGYEDDVARAIIECYARIDGDHRDLSDFEPAVTAVKTYAARRQVDRQYLLGSQIATEQYFDPTGIVLESLSTTAPTILPRPYLSVKASETVGTPALLLVDQVAAAIRAEPRAGFVSPPPSSVTLRPRIFEDATVPSRDDPNGVVLRVMIADILDIFEVNRREAAGHLVTLSRWFPGNYFKPSNAPVEVSTEKVGTWIPEHILLETVLGCLLDLPKSPQNSVYYHTVLVELTKLSPKTIAPAMGKSVRRLYAGLGRSTDETDEASKPLLDAEGARRFAEWFSVHLSNFNFIWRWPEWEADLSLPSSHPKRQFIKRTVELAVRLSYFDRVRGTLPDPYKTGETSVMDTEAPGASFAYESETAPNREAAMEVLSLLRAKEGKEALLAKLDDVKQKATEEEHLTDSAADELKLDIAVQTILYQGSRSFAHLLNVLERYVEALHDLADSPTTRRKLLRIVGQFWRRHDQFALIAIDKLLQYRIVEPSDVLAWIFEADDSSMNVDGESNVESKHTWSGFLLYDLLRSTVVKVEGRVATVRGRLEQARQAHQASAVPAAETENAEAKSNGDVEMKLDPALGEQVANAERQLVIVEGQLESVIVEAIRQFSNLLAAGSSEDDWTNWWQAGWCRQFCRSHAHYIAQFSSEIDELRLDDASEVGQLVKQARDWTGRAVTAVVDE